MTPTEKLVHDIAVFRSSYHLALREAVVSRSPNQVAEVKKLIGALAAEIQMFIPLPANSN